MSPNSSRRPSPAMVVAGIALLLALVGTALARPSASSIAPTKKQVKKIANSVVTSRAPGLSVQSATNAQNAQSATSAQNAANLAGKPPSSYEETASADYAESNLTLSVDSSAPSTLNTLVLPGPASYLVHANASMFNTGGACGASFDIRRDDTSVAFNIVGTDAAGGFQSTYSAERLLNVTGASSTITVTGYRQFGAGSCVAYSRSLVAEQVDNTTGAF